MLNVGERRLRRCVRLLEEQLYKEQILLALLQLG